jgi:hypothetical protein
MGEAGAERLGILPVTPSSSGKCVKRADAAEKIINSNDWSGYFMGVRKNDVFFGGADRINSSLPFAVFDAGAGKKVMYDSPAVISYPVEVVLGAVMVTKPVAGEIRCWPAD